MSNTPVIGKVGILYLEGSFFNVLNTFSVIAKTFDQNQARYYREYQKEIFKFQGDNLEGVLYLV